LLLKASTLLLALNNLTKSSIFTLILSFYFCIFELFYNSDALFKKFDATDIDEASLDIKTIWANYLF
jgi:hypothetical protein